MDVSLPWQCIFQRTSNSTWGGLYKSFSKNSMCFPIIQYNDFSFYLPIAFPTIFQLQLLLYCTENLFIDNMLLFEAFSSSFLTSQTLNIAQMTKDYKADSFPQICHLLQWLGKVWYRVIGEPQIYLRSTQVLICFQSLSFVTLTHNV